MNVLFAVVDEQHNTSSVYHDFLSRTKTFRIANQHDLEVNRDGDLFICGVKVVDEKHERLIPYIPYGTVSLFPSDKSEEYLLQRLLGISNWFGLDGTPFWKLSSKE